MNTNHKHILIIEWQAQILKKNCFNLTIFLNNQYFLDSIIT